MYITHRIQRTQKRKRPKDLYVAESIYPNVQVNTYGVLTDIVVRM